jgi:endo-1,4-beta-xylanase
MKMKNRKRHRWASLAGASALATVLGCGASAPAGGNASAGADAAGANNQSGAAPGGSPGLAGATNGGFGSGGSSASAGLSGRVSAGGTPGASGSPGGGVNAAGSSSAGSSAAPAGGTNAGGTNAGGTNAGGTHAGSAGATTGGTHAGGAAAAGGAGAAGSAGTSGGNLKKFVGNITTSGVVRDGFVKYWSQITPENEGKWGSVEATRGNRDWTALDKIYQYAQDNQIVFKQHNFVWGQQQPNWIAGLSPADQQTAVKDWISAFCARYPKTQMIDVVNEPPPHTTPVYKDAIGGDGASGYDWIVNAFKWARAACPNAILVLNDYNTIEYAADNAHFIQIVNAIKKAGAPIDAIGAQAHGTYQIQTNSVKGFVDTLSATGLPVYISEFDIPIADDNQQKAVMQEQMTMFWNHRNIKGITLWGYIVGATWKANTGIQQPDGTMRPAMSWLMTFLGR